MTSSSSFSQSPSVSEGHEIKLKDERTVSIRKYSALDERIQKIALTAIREINQITSTDGVKSWEDCGYTSQICERINECKNAKNTLFIAFDGEKVVGYVAFYTTQDGLSYANRFLESANEAYCSWIAVDSAYRGQGLAEYLQLQIFEPEHDIQIFKEHIKKTNMSALKVLQRYSEKGYPTTQESRGHIYLCSVQKKNT